MDQVLAVARFSLAPRAAAALALVAAAVLWAPALPAAPLVALLGA